MADKTTIDVNPPGYLTVGMRITITCTVRYGGPSNSYVAAKQNPTLGLALDKVELSGHVHYTEPADNTDNFHQKTLVTWTFDVRKSSPAVDSYWFVLEKK